MLYDLADLKCVWGEDASKMAAALFCELCKQTKLFPRISMCFYIQGEWEKNWFVDALRLPLLQSQSQSPVRRLSLPATPEADPRLK